MTEQRENGHSEHKLNVTWSGECPGCGIVLTVTGYRCDDTPEARAKLGTETIFDTRCPLCTVLNPLLCVGVCLAPFAATEVEHDDEEDEVHGCAPMDCPDCDGSGVLDADGDIECERCDGSGALTPWDLCPDADTCPSVNTCAEDGCARFLATTGGESHG